MASIEFCSKGGPIFTSKLKYRRKRANTKRNSEQFTLRFLRYLVTFCNVNFHTDQSFVVDDSIYDQFVIQTKICKLIAGFTFLIKS